MNFFNLADNFTLDELKQARNMKLNNLMKSNINDEDKKIYAEQILSNYKQQKYMVEYNNKITNRIKNLQQNMFSNMNSNIKQLNNMKNSSNYISHQKSMSQKSMPDGSIIVSEITTKTHNGKTEKTENSYKILPSGERVKLIQNHNH
jgi:hypothetical protein